MLSTSRGVGARASRRSRAGDTMTAGMVDEIVATLIALRGRPAWARWCSRRAASVVFGGRRCSAQLALPRRARRRTAGGQVRSTRALAFWLAAPKVSRSTAPRWARGSTWRRVRHSSRGPVGAVDTRFLRIGLHPGAVRGGCRSRVGPQTAAAMVLFGAAIDGRGAAEVGLAWACHPDDRSSTKRSRSPRAANVPKELSAAAVATLREAPWTRLRHRGRHGDHASVMVTRGKVGLDPVRPIDRMRTPSTTIRTARRTGSCVPRRENGPHGDAALSDLRDPASGSRGPSLSRLSLEAAQTTAATNRARREQPAERPFLARRRRAPHVPPRCALRDVRAGQCGRARAHRSAASTHDSAHACRTRIEPGRRPRCPERSGSGLSKGRSKRRSSNHRRSSKRRSSNHAPPHPSWSKRRWSKRRWSNHRSLNHSRSKQCRSRRYRAGGRRRSPRRSTSQPNRTRSPTSSARRAPSCRRGWSTSPPSRVPKPGLQLPGGTLRWRPVPARSPSPLDGSLNEMLAEIHRKAREDFGGGAALGGYRSAASDGFQP